MELTVIGCGLGRRKLMTKKVGLTEKITEYIEVSLLPEISAEDLALIFDTKLSSIKRVLTSLHKKKLIKKAGDNWSRR